MKKQLGLSLVMAAMLAACTQPISPSPEEPTPPARPTLAVPTRAPVQGAKDRGPVYVDSLSLLTNDSFPVEVHLAVSGNLPTPCHQLQMELAGPDTENQIHISLYSTADPSRMCTQVLQPFQERIPIPMQGVADGLYSVWLNGELVGEFEYPG